MDTDLQIDNRFLTLLLLPELAPTKPLNAQRGDGKVFIEVKMVAAEVFENSYYNLECTN